MKSMINSKEQNNNPDPSDIKLNQDNCINQNNKKLNSICITNLKENNNYLNEINNKEESIIKCDEENLLISFSNISELNKTNINKDNKSIYEKSINNDNLNICNYFEFTPENRNIKLVNNTYNNEIKKKNLNYIFNILNSDKKNNLDIDNNKTQIIPENNNKIKENNNSLISCSKNLYNDNLNFNFSSLKNISDIQYKNSNKKENNKKNYVIENIKNINIINSNDKNNKYKNEYEINNVNNIEIIHNKKQNGENIKNLSNINNTKHLSNFSFGINNFNIITNNGKPDYGNNHINYDENKIIETNNEYLSPKFNIPNGSTEYKNNNKINGLNKTKKKQFEISHIDLSNINYINSKISKESEINIGYTNLQKTKGFPSFSIIDKKMNNNFKKININKIKELKIENKETSSKKSKKKVKLNSSQNKILKKKIFPNVEELYMNNTTNNNKYIKIKTEKKKFNKINNMTLDMKNKSKKYSYNKIKNINIFSDNNNRNKMIDQNLKEKIQNILEKNFELILSNNLLNNVKRNSYRNRTNSKNNNNSSFNRSYSNTSCSKRINKNDEVKINTKKLSSCLYKGNHQGNHNIKKINSKYIFTNNILDKGNKSNTSLKKYNTNKNFSLKKENFNNKNVKNKCLKNLEKHFDRNEANIIKFIKTKTRNGVKQEKTYIIENKDINIFNIDINKNNNSLICYNIDKINTDECKNNKNGNNIIADNNNLIMKNSFNKYKKQFEVIRNFKNYKRKKEC
jgi:hypothetical protein